MTRFRLHSLWLCLLIGCPSPPAVDAGGDAGEPDDAGTDAGPPTDTPADGGTDAGPPRLEASEGSIDFGDWVCGDPAPAARSFTVRNTGGSPAVLTWTIEGAADYFTVDLDGPTTLAPGATTTFRVQPEVRVPIELSLSGERRATIILAYRGGGGPGVQLIVQREGADLLGGSADYDFGDVDLGIERVGGISVRNIGTRAANVELEASLGAGFTVDWPGVPGSIAAGATVNGFVRVRPVAVGETQATLHLRGTGAVCSASLSPSTLVARGASGSLRVAGGLDFGPTTCGAAAAAQSVEIRNAGSAALTWTAELGGGAGSAFLISPSSGALAPGATASVMVTPPTMPSEVPALPFAIEDRLTFTSSAAGDTPRTVDLRASATGGFLEWIDPTHRLLSAAPGTTVTTTERLTNRGSGPVTLTLVTGLPASFTHDWPAGGVLMPGETRTINVSFTASTSSESRVYDALTVSSATGLCAPQPLSFPSYYGEPVLDRLMVHTDQVTLSPGRCGGAPASDFVYVTNRGTADAELTLRVGEPFWIAIDGVPATTRSLPRDATVAIEIGAMGDPDRPLQAYSSYLHIASNDGDHYVGVHFANEGALVTASPVDLGTIARGVGAPITLPIENHGNRSVTLRAEAETGGYAFVTVPPAAGGRPGRASAILGTRDDHVGEFVEEVTLTEWGTAGVLCGTTPIRVQVGGAATTLALDVPAAIDVGNNPCHGVPTAIGDLIVRNVSGAPVGFTAQMAPGSTHFAVRTTSGTIAPGGSAALEVRALAVGDHRPGRVTETLYVSDGTTTYATEVSATVVGTRIVIGTADENIGNVRLGESAAVPLDVTVESTFDRPLFFVSAWSGDFAIEETTNAVGAIALAGRFTPSRAGADLATFDINLRPGVPSCGGTGSITLRGTGLAATTPPVSLPPVITFPRTGCGVPPAPVTFEIANGSTSMTLPFAITVGGSLLTVSPASGDLPPRGRRTITVTSAEMPQDFRPTAIDELSRDAGRFGAAIDESLSVTVGLVSYTVPVKLHAWGYAYVPVVVTAPGSHAARYELETTSLGGVSLPLAGGATYEWDGDATATPPGCTLIRDARSVWGELELGLRCAASGTFMPVVVSFMEREPRCSPVGEPISLPIP